MIFDNGSRKKLVIQQSAPSIPYKDSTYGYEPIDESGQLLINVGNSFKHTYPEKFDSSPGPGAYEIANDYLKRKNKDPTVRFDKDSSRRSNLEITNTATAVGPGSYNLDRDFGSRNVSNLGHAAFASGQKQVEMTPIEKDLLLKKISKLGALPHFTDRQRSKMLRQDSEGMGPPASLELYSTREAV